MDEPPVPKVSDPSIEAAVLAHPLPVSSGQVLRATRILSEFQRMSTVAGAEFAWSDADAWFEWRIGDDAYGLRLDEEMSNRVIPDDSIVVKYDWQRVPQVERKVHNGRLRLTVVSGIWQKPWWADRRKAPLEEKLPAALATLSEAAQAARDKREELRVQNERTLKAWTDAIPRARAAYIHRINADRADAQLAAWSKAKGLRDYASAITAPAWAEWLRGEADRIDPSLHPADLVFREPTDFPSAEVDKFMPHGWTVTRPPLPRTS